MLIYDISTWNSISDNSGEEGRMKKNKLPSRASNLDLVTGSPVHQASSHYSFVLFILPSSPELIRNTIYPSPGADIIIILTSSYVIPFNESGVHSC